ncbi:MAG TPA: right-handed parallel beta-helix repeat-containing protein [Mycobacteriales bacterium]|nr:right-handed parallel beta-helix repeat-containing protein [Mycobacteriales bacterium]
MGWAGGPLPRTAYFAVGVALLPLLGAGHPRAPGPTARASTATVPELDIVAAPDGAGVDCTYADPCSIDVAQEILTARSTDPIWNADRDLVLENGTYRLTAPLRITAQESGHDGYRTVIRAAAGATPVLSGGREVSGWHQVPGSADTWEAAIPKRFDTRQLYIDGHRRPMATAKLGGVGLLQTGTGFQASEGKQIDSWVNPRNVQAVFRGGNGPWTQSSCPIASISGTTIRMAEPCWHNLHLKALGVQELSWFDDPMGGFGGLAPWKAPTYFQNLYSALSPGHWVIDRVAHELYYDPRKGEHLAAEEVEVPVLQTLLSVSGTASRPVHDVTVSGLTFSYGTWTEPDSANGFPQMQADWYLSGAHANTREGTCHYSKPAGSCPFASWTRTPANVVLTHTSDVSVVGNRFVHLGGAGLDLYRGARGDLVEGNEFTDVAASAVQLGATSDARSPLEHHVTVTENYIHQVANQYLGGVGIWIGYSTYSRITHNYIEHVPYTAISIGWGGWHQTVLAPNRNPNGNAGNVVSNNVMYDYMHTLGDGGAIYSNGSQATSWQTALQERHNVAYRGTNTDFTFYTDAASRYVKIGGNFAYFQPLDSFDTGGCHTVGHIRTFNNYFSQGGPAYPCFAYTDIVTSHNTTVCQQPTPAQAPVAVMREAGLSPAYRSLMGRYRPEVGLVGPAQLPASGGEVLISGGGFEPGSVVKFGDRAATKVRVLSGDYIVATAPPGAGKVTVTVISAAGSSQRSAYSQLSYTKMPLPCQLSSGTGITTGLLS